MVRDETVREIFHGLRSDNAEELTQTCRKITSLAPQFSDRQIEAVADGLTRLFYLDTVEHPEYSQVVDCAISTLVSLGPRAVGALIADLVDSDLHVNVLIARTLARMGRPAAVELAEKFRHSRDPYTRSVALFAMSLMKEPVLIDLFPEILSTLDHDHPELRDSATGAVGHMIECFGSECLKGISPDHVFHRLLAKLADPHGGVRSKAVRSLASMGKAGLLSESQRQRLLEAVEAILGIDGRHSWDSAFNVRREAEKAYFHLTGREVEAEGPTGECPVSPRSSPEN